MSSILKALKKLEQEKSSRFPESMNINSDILGSTDSSRNISRLPLLLLFLLFFGGGIAVTFFFMKPPQSKPTLQPEITANSLQPTTLPTVVVKTHALPAEIEVVTAPKKSNNEVARKETKVPIVTNKMAGSIIKENTTAAVSDISKKPNIVTGSANKEIHATTAPTLRVNGIAFQNNGADNMAIVNGITVSIGSTIEGFAVEEIKRDRVLFKRNMEKLEIHLGQSN